MSNYYYSENSESEEKDELQNTYKKLFVKYSELRDLNKHVKMLKEFEIGRNNLLKRLSLWKMN
jgi:flagellar biosynthesis/type III secretory pathway chaperone